jgi:CubicO group peptidase (beta-lactamase class C family)
MSSPAAIHGVTIHQLLTHTSGMGDFHGSARFRSEVKS